MAKIQGVTRQVSQPASLGQARGSTAIYEPIAQGAQQLGGVIEKVGFEMDKKKALADIENAKTVMRQRILEQELDYEQNRQGESALDSDLQPGVYKQADQDYSKWSGELTQGISPRFQALATRELGAIAEGGKRNAAKYQSKQLLIHRKAAVDNGLSSITAKMNKDMEDPSTTISDIDAAAEEARVTIEANSGNRDVAEEVRNEQAKIYVSGVMAKAETDPDTAMEMVEGGDRYLGDNQKAMASLREAVEAKQIEVGTEVALSEITSLFNLETEFGEALDAAAQIPNEDVRKGVQSELKHNKSQLESIRLDKQRDSVEGYNDRIGKGDIPSELEVKQDPSLDSGMERLVLRWSQAEKDGVTLKTDQTVYQELNNIIAWDIEAFKKIDFANDKRYQDGLSQSDWRSFSNMQRDLRLGKTGGKPAAITHAMTLLKPDFSSADVTLGAKAKDEDNQAYKLVQNEVARWYGEQHDLGNTQITDEEILKKANRMFRDIKTSQPKTAFGMIDYTSRFEGKIFDMDYGDIPPADVEVMKGVLARQGVADPTEEEITDWYKRYLISIDEG